MRVQIPPGAFLRKKNVRHSAESESSDSAECLMIGKKLSQPMGGDCKAKKEIAGLKDGISDT